MQYEVAAALSGVEPEPRLLYGLLLLRDYRLRDEALAHFEELRIRYPEMLLPSQGLVWAHFMRRNYNSGVAQLREMIAGVPKPKKPNEPYPETVREAFQWAGQLREFAAGAPEEFRLPDASALADIDTAAAEHGGPMAAAYTEGRARSRAILDDFDRRIAAPPPGVLPEKLKIDKRQLSPRYAEFPFGAAEAILAGLDG